MAKTANEVAIDGLADFLRDMNKAPKETQRALRVAAKAIAETVAEDARSRARRANPQLAAAAPTIKAKSDRVPAVQAGGAKRVTSSGAKASQIFFGAEWGSDRLARFPRRTTVGRSIYPAIAANQRDTAGRYLDAIEEVFKG